MALTTHQFQGSCEYLHFFPHSSWCRGGKIKHFLPAFLPFGVKDRNISLKCRSSSSVGSSLTFGANTKPFKISAFKGGDQNEKTGGRTNDSSIKYKNKVSSLQHKSKEACADSSMVENSVSAQYSPDDNPGTRSHAIQALFRRWLISLRTPLEPQSVETEVEQSSSVETSELPKTITTKHENIQLLKKIQSSLMSLDTAITIPLLLFSPMYLAINMIHGSEVSKELTPLWILGPITVAVYIKVFQIIRSLYVLIFRHTIKVLISMPIYFKLIHEYVVSGKIKGDIQKHVLKPVVDIKKMNYKKASLDKMKELVEWLVEKYLDFVESVWPYYCRTIRFLKRANLI